MINLSILFVLGGFIVTGCTYTTKISSQVNNQEVSTYRVNTGLLFANFDGLRWSPLDITEIRDFFNKPISEIMRKADRMGQQSELKGYMKVILPSQTLGSKEVFLFDTQGKEQSVNFLEPALRSFTFSLPKNEPIPKTIKIECNIREIDGDTPDDAICDGTKEYQLYEIISKKYLKSARVNSGSPDDDAINYVADFLNIMGYEKIQSTSEFKNIKEVMHHLYDNRTIFDHFGIDDLKPLNDLIKGVSGIYLINANIENITNKSSGEILKYEKHYWSHEQDGFRKNNNVKGDVISNGSELYGQVYAMPEAIVVNLTELIPAGQMMIPETLVKILKQIDIPFIKGPAYPIFDMDYLSSSNADLALSNKTARLFDFELPGDNKNVVYFSNLWDRDGNSALDVDDCIARGNGFGFDQMPRIAIGQSVKLSRCDWHTDGNSVSILNLNLIPTEVDTRGKEIYEIEGTLQFTHNDGAGTHFEPYGAVTLNTMGNTHSIFNETADKMSVANGKYYSLPFKMTVAANQIPPLQIIGAIAESDSGSDDTIALTVTPIIPDLGKEYEFTYNGDGHAKLKIKVIRASRKL